MSNIFSSQTLTEKLSQLNNSQQSIESLSHWCISHRKKAKHVVEIWGKLFNSSQKEQRVPLLYLANDILQNSRRKGSEFVNEFWKLLPGSLKLVYENGDDHGKKVVMRLVGIWVERKVFGSRGRGLKDDILGKVAPPVSDNNGKSANPIIVVKKDAHTVRIKLSIGAMPEKIITAYQSVLEENSSEDTLNKCRSAVEDVKKMEKDVDNACTRGIQQGSPLMGGIQEQEAILEQCIEQLESIEATRTTLVAQLKEALEEQESMLELIHRQLQIAQAEKDHAISIKRKLASATVINGIAATTTTTNPPTATAQPSLEPKPPIQTPTAAPLSFVNALSSPSPQPSQHSMISFLNSITGVPPQPPQQPGTSFVNILTAEEENKKAAAAVAARLTASTSSAQMLASVLSSLAAEEAAAASMNGGGRLSSNTPPDFPPEKRPKLEKQMTANELSATYFGHVPLPPPLPHAPNPNLQQTMSQANLQPPPPPPPPFPRPTGVQQFVPASGMMVGVGPFSFGGNGLPPPPPPLVSRTGTPQPPPSPPPLPPSLPPQLQQQQQNSGFYQQSPMVGFYGPPLPPPRGSIASQGSST